MDPLKRDTLPLRAPLLFGLCIGILIGAIGAACQRGGRAPKGEPRSATATATAAGMDNQVAPPGMPPGVPLPAPTQPVYPTRLEGDAEPLAVALCEALHALPEQRRRACCGGVSGAVLTGECVRVLTYSVRSGAVRLDASDVGECRRAQAAAHAGCDWIGPWPPDLPASCRTALRGTLAAGAACRSSLECTGSQVCLGVGPTSPGRCTGSRPDGERCALGVDPLAAFTRQDRVEIDHPECAGFCSSRHLCEPARSLGSECVMSSQCGPDARCGKGRCIAGSSAGAGEPCSGDECPLGLRCFKGACQVPRGAGAACTSDFECSGGCIKPAGSASGRCAPKCGVS